jgi:hypothetical protein
MFFLFFKCLYIVGGPAENIVQYLKRQVILDKPVYCLWSSGKTGSISFPRPSGRRAYNAGNHRLNKVFVGVPAKTYSRMFSAALSAVQRLPHCKKKFAMFPSPEYVILDDFWSLYPRYTWGRAGVFLFSCIFRILDKSAESWCNCSLCRPELV